MNCRINLHWQDLLLCLNHFWIVAEVIQMAAAVIQMAAAVIQMGAEVIQMGAAAGIHFIIRRILTKQSI